jgi:hypothetical protein
MQTGVSAGQVPQGTEPPHPSSIAPHCIPPGHVVAGTQVVVVLEVVDAVLVELDVGGTAVLEVVGVRTGVAPQYGGTGSVLDRQTFVFVLFVPAHVDRHARPARPFAHSPRHSFS